MILLDATKNNLTVHAAKEVLVSGSVQVYPVKFRFNSDWDGLVKTAVFRAGGTAISVVLDDTGECTIPWEVLEKSDCILEAGVYGTKGGSVVLPTIWAELGSIHEGARPGENAQEPTPTVYQQLIEQTDAGRSAAQAAAARAQAEANRAAQTVLSVRAEGDAQVQRVAGEGAAQTAAAKEQADRAELAAGRQPYPNPDTDTWWIWDAESGEYKDSGAPYGGGGGSAYQIGSGLTLDPETNTLSVDAADAVERDNTKPITSAAVFVEVGNIEALLAAL